MASFTPEEIELLKRYVTDPTGDVFCVTNLPGMVGAAYARYSRAKGGFREVLLKEFIKEGVIDPKHADDLIQRILIAYGDDSVGELEGAHVSFENITMIATKEIEECRIGGSPIEQSTRYVFYDQKDEAGHYRYYVDPDIAKSKHAALYTETMDFIFDTYCRLIEPMQEYYQKLKPKSEAEYDILGTGEKQHFVDLKDVKDQKSFDRTYQADIRTRACDTLRSILPVATKTNVGMFGNGRFYQGLISFLLSSPYPEARRIGESAQKELNKIIPVYVRRAAVNDYQVGVEKAMLMLAEELTKDVEPVTDDDVALISQGEEYITHQLNGQTISLDTVKQAMDRYQDNLTLSLMLYSYTRHPLRQLQKLVDKLPDNQRQRIIKTYVGERRTRRDRPYRAMEWGYPYTFDLVTDFGVYKDIMRHRMSTQLRQQFSPLLGFNLPADVVTAGYEKDVMACHDRSVKLYEALKSDFPFQASYATLHGSKVRWLIGFNEREAYHLLELRTTPQGHPGYRLLGQKMHAEIKKRAPWRAEQMKFVDYNQYGWARGDAEAKQRVKERQLDDQQAKTEKS